MPEWKTCETLKLCFKNLSMEKKLVQNLPETAGHLMIWGYDIWCGYNEALTRIGWGSYGDLFGKKTMRIWFLKSFIKMLFKAKFTGNCWVFKN